MKFSLRVTRAITVALLVFNVFAFFVFMSRREYHAVVFHAVASLVMAYYLWKQSTRLSAEGSQE